MISILKPLTHLALLLLLALGGCASSPGAGLRQATVDFNAQRYTQSFEKARRISERSPAGLREDAAYIAGLSAFKLGQHQEAERQFSVAMGSTNVQTSAQSKAMLGQMRLDQRRPREAVPLLTDASRSLTGQDAQKAAYSAAIAYQQIGDNAAARQWLATSGGRSSEQPPSAPEGTQTATAAPSPYQRPVVATSGSGFTLQVGAFNDKKRAMKAAQDASPLAKRDGLGTVQIVQRRDERGRAMYVVQFGAFPTRESASAARSRLGRTDYIVAAAGAS